MTPISKDFTDTEIQELWILASEGLGAMKFKRSFRETWLEEDEAKRLVKKLDTLDNHIREKMAEAELAEQAKELGIEW